MSKKNKLVLVLAGWVLLALGGLLNISCLAPYYYDRDGHRFWRDGHDDDWHKAHGDHWDEYHADDHHDRDH